MNAISMHYIEGQYKKSNTGIDSRRAFSISFPVLFLLVVSQFLSQYIIWGLLVMALVASILLSDGKSRLLSMPGFTFYLPILIIGMISGIVGLWSGKTALWPYIRDVVYVTLFPLYWFCLTNKNVLPYRNKSEFYRTIYLFCGIMCGTSFFRKLIALRGTHMTLFELRHVSPVSEIIVALGIAMFFVPARGIRNYKSTVPGVFSSLFIFLAFALSFSRMTILYIIILFVFFGVHNRRAVFRITFLAIAFSIISGIIAPDISGDFFDKIKNSANEVVGEDKMWTSSEIVENWRGYEVACAKETFNEYGAVQQLFGAGFGKTIDMHGYAYLVTSEPDVPFLHNGYYTTLFKCGVVGVICMILFFASMFFHAMRLSASYEKSLVLGLVICMAVGSLFVSGVLWRVVNPLTMILYCEIWRSISEDVESKIY